VRVGNYRIIYTVHDDLLVVVVTRGIPEPTGPGYHRPALSNTT